MSKSIKVEAEILEPPDTYELVGYRAVRRGEFYFEGSQWREWNVASSSKSSYFVAVAKRVIDVVLNQEITVSRQVTVPVPAGFNYDVECWTEEEMQQIFDEARRLVSKDPLMGPESPWRVTRSDGLEFQPSDVRVLHDQDD